MLLLSPQFLNQLAIMYLLVHEVDTDRSQLERCRPSCALGHVALAHHLERLTGAMPLMISTRESILLQVEFQRSWARCSAMVADGRALPQQR